jgi:DNA replication protein DnaC
MDEYCVAINDSNPVAVVLGGRYDGRKVSIAKKDDYQSDAEEDERDPLEQLDLSDFLQNFALMDVRDRLKIVRGLKSREDKTSKYAKKYKESCKRELKLDAGQFVIMPTERTERVYIAGKSGVGKSTLASMYIREYNEMFPDRQKKKRMRCLILFKYR